VRFISTCLFSAALIWAQEDHSRHTHAVAGLGSVKFATTCSSAGQQQFSRAIALLHSFGYAEARTAFQNTAKADNGCAIAHWGEAMTWYHPIWLPPSPEELKQGAAAIERALATPAGSRRERDYIEALAAFYKDWQGTEHRSRAAAYEQRMAGVHGRYPADDEAAIFHALQILSLGYLDPTDKTYSRHKQAAKILNSVLPRNQDHPGVAHYVIHSFDFPSLANLALPAARAYAKIAQDASHAQHMPSHIFIRLGLWDDSISSNIAAAAAAVSQAQRTHGGGGAFDQLHAMDYLVYAYLQNAQDHSARRVLDQMAAISRLDEQQFAAAYAFAAAPARYALERRDWKAAARLELAPAWFPWNRFPNVVVLLQFARAIGAARAGDHATATGAVQAITGVRKALPPSRDYDWSGAIGAQWEAASALLAYAEGKKEEGLEALRRAADREDSIDKHPVTPGAVLPVREILADLLVENGRHTQALAEYEAVLRVAPRRFNSVAGAAGSAQAAGDAVKARRFYTELLKLAQKAEVDRPEISLARAFLDQNTKNR